MSGDHYTRLGLQRDASLDEIKKAYRQLAMRHHPDRTQNNPQDTEIFKAVAVAFAILSNPERRAEYDRSLAAAELRAPQPRGRGTRTTTSDRRRQNSPFGDIIEEFFSGVGSRAARTRRPGARNHLDQVGGPDWRHRASRRPLERQMPTLSGLRISAVLDLLGVSRIRLYAWFPPSHPQHSVRCRLGHHATPLSRQ
jgi:DnaJ-class molecular chaperone